jgi:hypothetical protein
MRQFFDAKTITAYVDCPWRDVHGFAANPANLPLWASGLAQSIQERNGRWVFETPGGPAEVRFAPRNDFGVLDHWVLLADGSEIYVPFRVVANGKGSELIFTLFRQPEMTEADFARDVDVVTRDLQTLKDLLERRCAGATPVNTA